MKSSIEHRIMANVGVIYIARLFLSRVALEGYALFISLLLLARLVFVSHIIENFMSVEKNGLGPVSAYLMYAVEHTHLAVQLTLLVAALALGGLVLDAMRSIRSLPLLQHRSL